MPRPQETSEHVRGSHCWGRTIHGRQRERRHTNDGTYYIAEARTNWNKRLLLELSCQAGGAGFLASHGELPHPMLVLSIY